MRQPHIYFLRKNIFTVMVTDRKIVVNRLKAPLSKKETAFCLFFAQKDEHQVR